MRTAAALGMALLLAGAAACRERGRPDPTVRMIASHEQTEESAPMGRSAGGPGAGPEVPTRLEVPPEVEETWSGVRLAWKDLSNGKEGTIDVPLGGAAPLPDPTLVVRADVFLPAFSMGGGAITSSGVEPENPAARVAVFEKGQQVFGGWIFQRFPDVHPFSHSRWQLRLEGGVRKTGK